MYKYSKEHPEDEEEIQSTVTSVLGATVGTFIRRAIEQRKNAENPCKHGFVMYLTSAPSLRDGRALSPMKSPSRPESVPHRVAARKSLGPRPSSLAVVDKSAPIDAQLAQYKNVFSRSSGYLTGSNSPDSTLHSAEATRTLVDGERVGEPLVEISLQSRPAPRSSDVD